MVLEHLSAVVVEEASDQIGRGLQPELVEMGGGAGDVRVTLPASLRR